MADQTNPLHFEFGNHTDIGRVRQANEDYLGYFNTLNGHVFVVCDGMGGHLGGATAAQTAVDSVRTFFEHRYYEFPREALRQAMLFANGQIHAAAQENPQLRGMGTTCVLVLYRKGEVWFAHVGDSRIYRLSDGRLERLTKDHSYVQQLMDQGLLTEAEAENHPRRNELTRALGTSREVLVDVSSQPLMPGYGDVLLLCTDGLTGLLPDETIRQELLAAGPVQRRAMRLVERANEAGGYDNITVQLIGFQPKAVTAAATGTPVVLPPVPATGTPAPAPLPPVNRNPNPRPEPPRPRPEPVIRREPEPVIDSEMAKRTVKSTTAAARKKKGPDVALIILCGLALVVFVMFLSGLRYLSDEPVENSELVSSTLGTAPVPAEEEPAPAPRNQPAAARPAAAARTAPATATPAASRPVSNPATGSGQVISHTVRTGETFSSVARRYNLNRETLKKLNPAIKNEGTDIKADVTKLNVRVKAIHTVGPGDILDVVSRKYKVPKEMIMTANAKTNDRASRGENLIIPFAEKQ
jgi:serine/threonine protein phosphatase PrpC/LysM repeat protein